MAEAKILLSGTELVELRVLLGKQARQLNDDQILGILKSIGYEDKSHVGIEEQLSYIAERLLSKLR